MRTGLSHTSSNGTSRDLDRRVSLDTRSFRVRLHYKMRGRYFTKSERFCDRVCLVSLSPDVERVWACF